MINNSGIIKPGDEVMYTIDDDDGVYAFIVQKVFTIYNRTYVEGEDNTGGGHLVALEYIMNSDKKELPDGPNKTFKREV